MRKISFICGAIILAACSRMGNQGLPFAAPANTAVQPASHYGYIILHNFGGSDGASPAANLLLAKGELYGTTTAGGTHGDGVVFKMKTSGGEQVLHSFDGAGGNGIKPYAGLVRYYGLFYGTTNGGIPSKPGTIYVVDHSGNFQTLHRFGRGLDGKHPQSALVPVGNRLYGTTNYGGADNRGSAFAFTPAGRERLIHSFGPVFDGNEPDASLTRVGDKLYGITLRGGAYGGGTIFSLTTGGSLHTVHSFGRSFDGKHPTGAALLYFDKNLYGTTCSGGTHGMGTVFRISLTGNEEVLYNFGDYQRDGSCPSAGLIEVRGSLFGTTFTGGENGAGIVFALPLHGGPAQHLHDFGIQGDGAYPLAGLTYSDDVLYGTTSSGGGLDHGTVFELLMP